MTIGIDPTPRRREPSRDLKDELMPRYAVALYSSTLVTFEDGKGGVRPEGRGGLH
jgi:hypothetical protein